MRQRRNITLAATALFKRKCKEVGMNKDQVKGRVKQAEGKVEEAAGKAVGNERLQVKGQVNAALGKVQSAYGDIKEAVEKKP